MYPLNSAQLRPVVGVPLPQPRPVYGAIPPTGYDWKASTWVSTSALVDRMNFALTLAANHLPGATIAWTALPGSATSVPNAIPTPESEEARLEPLLLPSGVSPTTRAAALQQFAAQTSASVKPVAAKINNRPPGPNATERQDQLLAGLLIGSPNFQRR